LPNEQLTPQVWPSQVATPPDVVGQLSQEVPQEPVLLSLTQLLPQVCWPEPQVQTCWAEQVPEAGQSALEPQPTRQVRVPVSQYSSAAQVPHSLVPQIPK
jgi:hypothetical protein